MISCGDTYKGKRWKTLTWPTIYFTKPHSHQMGLIRLPFMSTDTKRKNQSQLAGNMLYVMTHTRVQKSLNLKNQDCTRNITHHTLDQHNSSCKTNNRHSFIHFSWCLLLILIWLSSARVSCFVSLICWTVHLSNGIQSQFLLRSPLLCRRRGSKFGLLLYFSIQTCHIQRDTWKILYQQTGCVTTLQITFVSILKHKHIWCIGMWFLLRCRERSGAVVQGTAPDDAESAAFSHLITWLISAASNWDRVLRCQGCFQLYRPSWKGTWAADPSVIFTAQTAVCIIVVHSKCACVAGRWRAFLSVD